VTITGIYLPEPYTGYRAIRSGLIHNTYLEAYKFVRHKKTHTENRSISPEMVDRIEQARVESNIYDHLASSIAPEIWGMDDVKKSLLLLLVGGVTK
jgi:DNA replication licensing factor MCM7